MTDKNKKKSPFSIYWIYAIIGIALIGFQLFMGSTSSVSVKSEEIFFDLAKQGFVDEAFIVNSDHVDFKISEDGLKYISESTETRYDEMKKLISKAKQGQSKIKYSIQISNVNSFTTRKDDLNSELKADGKPIVDLMRKDEPNYLAGILNFLLPIGILVLIWFFVMRRMGGGSGGGGAGGQIFNIGKSKAKVYEKGKRPMLHFKMLLV